MLNSVQENIKNNFCTLLHTLAQDSSISEILDGLLNLHILILSDSKLKKFKFERTVFDRARDLLLYLFKHGSDIEIENLKKLSNEPFYPNVKQAIELMLTGEQKTCADLDDYIEKKNILSSYHFVSIKRALDEIYKKNKDNFFIYLIANRFLSSSDEINCDENPSSLLDYLMQQTNLEKVTSCLKAYCCENDLNEQAIIFAGIHDQLNTVNQKETLVDNEVTKERNKKIIDNFIQQISQEKIAAQLKKMINPCHGFIEFLLGKGVITFDKYIYYAKILLNQPSDQPIEREINEWLISIFKNKKDKGEDTEEGILAIHDVMLKTKHNLPLELLFKESLNNDYCIYENNRTRIFYTLNAGDQDFLQALALSSWEKEALELYDTDYGKNNFFLDRVLPKGITKESIESALEKSNQYYLIDLFGKQDEQQALLFNEQREFCKMLQSNRSFLVKALEDKVDALVQNLTDDQFFSFCEKEKILKNVTSLKKTGAFLDKLEKCAIFYGRKKIINAIKALSQSSYLITIFEGEISHQESMKLLESKLEINDKFLSTLKGKEIIDHLTYDQLNKEEDTQKQREILCTYLESNLKKLPHFMDVLMCDPQQQDLAELIHPKRIELKINFITSLGVLSKCKIKLVFHDVIEDIAKKLPVLNCKIKGESFIFRFLNKVCNSEISDEVQIQHTNQKLSFQPQQVQLQM